MKRENIRYKITIKGKIDEDEKQTSTLKEETKKVGKTNIDPDEHLAILFCCLIDLLIHIYNTNEKENKISKKQLRQLIEESIDTAEADYKKWKK